LQARPDEGDVITIPYRALPGWPRALCVDCCVPLTISWMAWKWRLRQFLLRQEKSNPQVSDSNPLPWGARRKRTRRAIASRLQSTCALIDPISGKPEIGGRRPLTISKLKAGGRSSFEARAPSPLAQMAWPSNARAPQDDGWDAWRMRALLRALRMRNYGVSQHERHADATTRYRPTMWWAMRQTLLATLACPVASV